jgi:tetratricopeptide (TPR) repeat protein
MKGRVGVAIAFALGNAACGAHATDARWSAGPSYPDRFIAPEAYAASLEATLAEEAGDWPSAVTWLTKARELDGESLDLQVRLGVALCEAGKPDAAKFAIEDAIRIAPTMERAFTARAKCALVAGDIDAAAIDLKRAIALDPEAREPVMWLVRLDLMRHESAATDPKESVTARSLDGTDAVARLSEWLILHPTDREVAERLAKIRSASTSVSTSTSTSASTSTSLTGADDDPQCAELAASFHAIAVFATREERLAMASAFKAACP